MVAAANNGQSRCAQARAAGIHRGQLWRWLTEARTLVDHLAGRPPTGRRQRLLVRLHVELSHKDREWCRRRQSDLITAMIEREDRELDELVRRLLADGDNYVANWLRRRR